ncbi:hypothetical protein MMC22_007289 [Lobaria immixta]|nr:hypothetical protein [Lobaria immixta]
MRRIVITALTLVFCTCVHSLTIGQRSPITTESDKQWSTIGKRNYMTSQIAEQSSTANQDPENAQPQRQQSPEGKYPDEQTPEIQYPLPRFKDIQRVHLKVPFPFQGSGDRPSTDQFRPVAPTPRIYTAFRGVSDDSNSSPWSLQSGATSNDQPDILDTTRLYS